jgi:hypothetical protein
VPSPGHSASVGTLALYCGARYVTPTHKHQPHPSAPLAHRATHRLLCHHPATVRYGSRSERLLTVPYSENGPASRGPVSQPWRTSNLTRRPNSGKFQQKTSAGASNSSRIGVASVCVPVRACVRKGPTLKVIRLALPCGLPLQCRNSIPGTFLLPFVIAASVRSPCLRNRLKHFTHPAIRRSVPALLVASVSSV